MGQQRWFCRGTDEWTALAQRLKHTPCPHCQVVGTLNRHGCLYGFDDQNLKHKTLRARRVFCSNRQARPGCGRTFSVWCADKIRRLSLTTHCLWRLPPTRRRRLHPRRHPCHPLPSQRPLLAAHLATIQPQSIQAPHGTVRALPTTATARRSPATARGTSPRPFESRLSPCRLSHRRLPRYAARFLHLGRFSGLPRPLPGGPLLTTPIQSHQA